MLRDLISYLSFSCSSLQILYFCNSRHNSANQLPQTQLYHFSKTILIGWFSCAQSFLRGNCNCQRSLYNYIFDIAKFFYLIIFSESKLLVLSLYLKLLLVCQFTSNYLCEITVTIFLVNVTLVFNVVWGR